MEPPRLKAYLRYLAERERERIGWTVRQWWRFVWAEVFVSLLVAGAALYFGKPWRVRMEGSSAIHPTIHGTVWSAVWPFLVVLGAAFLLLLLIAPFKLLESARAARSREESEHETTRQELADARSRIVDLEAECKRIRELLDRYQELLARVQADRILQMTGGSSSAAPVEGATGAANYRFTGSAVGTVAAPLSSREDGPYEDH